MQTVQDQAKGCTSFERRAREKVNPSTKHKKRKYLSSSQTEKSRARVNIGIAFNRWRALKAARGLNSDAEVALCLLDEMKRLPPRSASTGADGPKIQFSQSEVKSLIRQEVCSEVQRNEARLQSLIETIQQLNNGLSYEKSKLEARVSRVSKKAEAALSYVMKTQMKENIKREPEKSTCNAELEEKRRPPGPTPNGFPECSGFGKVIKKEPEDPQERENSNEESDQFEEPKAKKVKAECVSPGSTSNPRYTNRDTVQRGLVFPPLPANTFPSTLSMEAASYSIPQKLEVQLALIKNPTSLSVLWKEAEEVPSPPPMDSYKIFLTMEKIKGTGIFPDWKVLGEVKAIELPMCVLIRKHKPGHKVCAAVVGKDIFGRYGPYSTVVTAAIPDELD